MVSFYVGGVAVRATFGFFLLAFLFLLVDSGGMALWMLAGCLIHEGGHLMAMKLLSVPVRRVELTAGGIHLRRGGESLSPGRELLVLAAGPGINLLAAFLLLLLEQQGPSAVNCALGLFHFLPARGLDGGSILLICCQRLWGIEKGGWVAGIVFWILWLGVLALLGWAGSRRGFSLQTAAWGLLAAALLPLGR